MWINLIYKTVSGRLLLWQSHYFTNMAMLLLPLYHHRDGFVHYIPAAKPYSDYSSFDKSNAPFVDEWRFVWLQLLTNAAVDIILRMCVESPTTLSSFIDTCSQSDLAAECFQKMALLWRVSTSEINLVEKVSVFLQKLSKIRSRCPVVAGFTPVT